MGWGFSIPGVPNPLKKAEKVVKNVAGAAEDVVGAGSEALAKVEDVAREVVDPVLKLGENLEDGLREAVDDVDKLIQDPYVQLAVSIFAPQTAPFLDAYATLDSGETLSPSQIAALAASGYELDSGTKLPSDVKKGLNVGTKLAEGADPIKTLVSAYGEDFLESSGIKAAGEQGLQKAIGSDAYNLVRDNMDVARVGYDVLVEGKDPLEAISNRYGDEIVGLLGSDNPSVNALGYAGLATAVQLDKGKEPEDALLVGAREYYDRGGKAPNLGTLASTAGINFDNINIGKPEFFNKFTGSLGLSPDFAFAEDFVREYSPYIEDSVRYLADLVPSVDVSGVNFNRIMDLGLGLEDIGTDIASNLDFSGVKFRDLGVDFGEMPEYGIEVGDIDFDFDLFNLPFGLGEQAQPQGLERLAVAPLAEEEEEVQAEQVDIPELLLADFQLKNPLLRG